MRNHMNDIEFLNEMLTKLRDAREKKDVTLFDDVEQMMEDWIDELETNHLEENGGAVWSILSILSSEPPE